MAEREDLPLTTKKPKFFYGYVVAAAGFGVWLIGWGTFGLLSLFYKPLIIEFGWTRAEIAGAFSLSGIVVGLLSIVMGRLTDRFGPRVVVAIFGSFSAIAFWLVSQLSALWQLYLFWGVIRAIGISTINVPIMSTIGRWFIKRRGTIIGIVQSGAGIGGMIFVLIGGWLIVDYGWRFASMILGIITLIGTVSSALFLRRDPGQMGLSPYGANEVEEQDSSLQARGLSLQEAIHTRQFRLLLTVYVSFGMTTGALVHIAPHITDLGFSLIDAASVLAIRSGAGFAGRLMTGYVADRIGNRTTLMINFIVMTVAFFWLLVAKEMWLLYLFAGLFGYAWGGLAVLRFSTTSELFGSKSLGAIMGIAELGAKAGSTVCPLLLGWLFDIMDSYQLGFIISGTFGIIGFITASLLKPVSKK